MADRALEPVAVRRLLRHVSSIPTHRAGNRCPARSTRRPRPTNDVSWLWTVQTSKGLTGPGGDDAAPGHRSSSTVQFRDIGPMVLIARGPARDRRPRRVHRRARHRSGVERPMDGRSRCARSRSPPGGGKRAIRRNGASCVRVMPFAEVVYLNYTEELPLTADAAPRSAGRAVALRVSVRGRFSARRGGGPGCRPPVQPLPPRTRSFSESSDHARSPDGH